MKHAGKAMLLLLLIMTIINAAMASSCGCIMTHTLESVGVEPTSSVCGSTSVVSVVGWVAKFISANSVAVFVRANWVAEFIILESSASVLVLVMCHFQVVTNSKLISVEVDCECSDIDVFD